MSLDRRLGRLEGVEQDAVARELAGQAGRPVAEVRQQLDLWEGLLPVHGLSFDEQAPVERIREFLIDFATRIGDEEPERYAAETIAEWAAEDEQRRTAAVSEGDR